MNLPCLKVLKITNQSIFKRRDDDSQHRVVKLSGPEFVYTEPTNVMCGNVLVLSMFFRTI